MQHKHHHHHHNHDHDHGHGHGHKTGTGAELENNRAATHSGGDDPKSPRNVRSMTSNVDFRSATKYSKVSNRENTNLISYADI